MIAVLLLTLGQIGADPTVSIATDHGRVRQYSLNAALPAQWRANQTQWHQRVASFHRGDEYSLTVRCPVRSKVGIAVDGRSTLSGRQITGPYWQLASWKQFAGDRVHVCGPDLNNEVRGWREDSQRIRRFVATSPARSLAAAWGTADQMGTIVIAIFPEVQGNIWGRGGAGTGAGTEEWQPNQIVQFQSATVATDVFLIRYTLADQSPEVSPAWSPPKSNYIGPIPERW